MSKNANISLLARGHHATQLSWDAMRSVNELVYKLSKKPTLEEALETVKPESREERIQIERLKQAATNVNELN